MLATQTLLHWWGQGLEAHGILHPCQLHICSVDLWHHVYCVLEAEFLYQSLLRNLIPEFKAGCLC